MCIPKPYINKFKLDIPDSDEEYNFQCMECTEKNQDSDN